MNRRKWFECIEAGFTGNLAARIFAVLLIALILLSTAAVVLESDAAFAGRWVRELLWFDRLSIAIFTAEYLLRLWVAPEHARYRDLAPWAARARYVASPLALIDLIAILPAFLGLFVGMDLRYMRLFRLLRILKLTHYFRGLSIFLTVVRSQLRALMAAVFTISVLVIISASLMYVLEHQAQPALFGNISEAVWWAIVTMTTVGYGDVTPITTAGRFLAAIIMLLGVGIVALPSGILAARFVEELQARRSELEAQLDRAAADGRLDSTELDRLAALSSELGVSQDTLERMLRTRRIRLQGPSRCPHCDAELN